SLRGVELQPGRLRDGWDGRGTALGRVKTQKSPVKCGLGRRDGSKGGYTPPPPIPPLLPLVCCFRDVARWAWMFYPRLSAAIRAIPRLSAPFRGYPRFRFRCVVYRR